MLMAEFHTAVGTGCRSKVVINNNSSLGQILWEQMVLGYPEHGVRFGEPVPDYAAWARGGRRSRRAGGASAVDAAGRAARGVRPRRAGAGRRRGRSERAADAGQGHLRAGEEVRRRRSCTASRTRRPSRRPCSRIDPAAAGPLMAVASTRPCRRGDGARRAGVGRRRCGPRYAARCGSTPVPGRRTPRTRRTTGRCRSGWSIPRRPRRCGGRRGGLPRGSARRCSPGAAVPASAASAPTRPSCWTWPSTVNAVESVDPVSRGPRSSRPVSCWTNSTAAGREPDGLVFGPKPATHDHCTIGGMLGNNSCGSTAQWAGTTAGERAPAGGADLRRGTDVGRPDRRTDRAGATVHGEVGRPRSTASCVALRDRYVERDPHRVPDRSRAGSPGTTCRTCCRRTGSTWPGRWSARSRPASPSCAPSSTCCPSRPTRATLLVGYDDIATAAERGTAGERAPTVRRWKGWTTSSSSTKRDRRLNTVPSHEIPEAGRVADGEAQRRHGRRGAGAGATACAMRCPRRTATCGSSRVYIDDGRPEGAGLGAGDGARRDRPGTGDARHLARLGGLRGTAGAARRLPARPAGACCDEYGYDAASLYGHFGHGCVHTSIPFDLMTAEGIADVPVVRHPGGRPGRSRTAARCPASTATGRPAANCCPSCSATIWCRPSASSRPSSTRPAG